MPSKATVIVIDDDPSFRETLERLIGSAGFSVVAFSNAQEFLRHRFLEATAACLVLDIRLPGINGLDLQKRLASGKRKLPIIFLTAYADIRMSVQAMKAGAVDFLTKPFREKDLLDAIHVALDCDRAGLRIRAELRELRSKYNLLTPREREVMTGIVAGRLNKQIAGDLGSSEKTVKFHRGHIMHKMGAPSLAVLVRMATRLETIASGN